MRVADAHSCSPAFRLRFNKLQDEGTITNCNTLRESKVSKLQELDISHNGITKKGAKSVAAYLAVTGSLTRLDVSSNYLDRGGRGRALRI